MSWVPGLLGAGASLLHPWHGELLILTVVVAELMLPRPRNITRQRLMLPALTLILTGLPLLYYLLLGHARSLVEARPRGRASIRSRSRSIVLAIVPLLIPALVAYRKRGARVPARRDAGLADRRAGHLPFSASGASATPLHAFQGITVPLAVLAVTGRHAGELAAPSLPPRGLPSPPWPLVTIPATAYELYNAGKFASPTAGNANFITRDERSAIDYLATDRDPGGVLTRSYLGAAVPGKTGRRMLVGDCLWSEPHCHRRGPGHRGAVRRPPVAGGRASLRSPDGRALHARRLPHAHQPPADAPPADRRRASVRVRDGLRDQPARVSSGKIRGECQQRLFALRGANSVERNEADAILDGNRQLMRELMQRNGLTPESMVSCIFTLTDDLDAEFPAVAARRLGLDQVPLLCAREIPVPGSMPHVIRAAGPLLRGRGPRAPARLPREARELRSDLDAAQ